METLISPSLLSANFIDLRTDIDMINRSEYSQCAAEPLTLNFHRTDHKDGSATYLREFLRQYMMAKRPERSDYPSWNRAQFVVDSIQWENDPLYGWCNKNYKKDGSPYNVYSDGLKVFTTIDSRIQQYAEEAMYQHVARYLQPRLPVPHPDLSKAPPHRWLRRQLPPLHFCPAPYLMD